LKIGIPNQHFPNNAAFPLRPTAEVLDFAVEVEIRRAPGHGGFRFISGLMQPQFTFARL
jgi:hypothetical protein